MSWDFLYAIFFIVGMLFFASAMILSVFILVNWLREYHAGKNEELETPDYDEDEVRMKGRP